jgi:toluene monooxygenase electron transfer component
MSAVVVVADRAGRKVSFDAAPGERILHAGLLAGAGLPFECASGTCGACKARRVSGEVIDLWPKLLGERCSGPRTSSSCANPAAPAA